MSYKNLLSEGLRKLRYVLSPRRPQPPSMVRALHQLVPRRVLREVVSTSSDRRQWGVLAAAWVGVSERELFAAAAKVMALELESRVPVPDLTHFGDRARPIVGELRRCGAAIVVRDSEVVRIVSIDPAEVRSLSFYKPDIALSLGTWSDISAVLDDAERIVMEAESNGDRHHLQQKRSICNKIIDLVLKEAAAHGAQSVDIVTSAGKTKYQFLTSQGRHASGSIRPEVVKDLVEYLSSVKEGSIHSESHGSIILRSLGSPSNFKLLLGRGGGQRYSEDGTQDANADLVTLEQAPLDRRAESRSEISEAPVLVVDDNPMFCRVLERMLKRDGFAPSFADNGHVALEKLGAVEFLRPKLIICDLHMPIMNGREFLAHLKKKEQTCDIPVIILTSDDDSEVEMQLLSDGADAFVPKAKDPRVLIAQAKRLLQASVSREAA